MKGTTWRRTILRLGSLLFLVGWFANAQSTNAPGNAANADNQTAYDTLQEIDRLIEQNARLERQNRELMQQIEVLRRVLAQQAAAARPTNQGTAPTVVPIESVSLSKPAQEEEVAPEAAVKPEKEKEWGTYTPNLGFKLADTRHGDLSLSIYTYARYLNQKSLKDTFTDSFGNVKSVQQRQDFQLQKLQMKFLGWVLDPKMRYFLYAWTSNANQGQGAQVVLAGNINYDFNKYVSLGLGVFSLPNTRSVEGNFPFWLSVDSRQIADEFFRGSYTTGLQIRGQITDTLRYQAMLANNLSTLGVSAAQLDNQLNTFGSALVWMPTTGEYGLGYGDFENHEKVATRLAAHFSRSNENKESQPGTDVFENTQIKLSDGNIVFTQDLFGPGITVTDLRYRMTAVDGGVKYHGYEFMTQYFWRWLDNFKGPGTAGLHSLFDQGFEMQASAFVVPKNVQLYAGGSKIFGQHGDPFDIRSGVNWFPWKNRVVRWGNEVLYLYRSPVGYTSVPFANGGQGFVFHSTWELAF
jgi:hypothetical protein